MCAYYPESKVEITGFWARHYDAILDIASFKLYTSMIKEAIRSMEIKPTDKILDLGAGTGKNALLMEKYLSAEGEILGLDIGDEMISQFEKNCADFPNINIVKARVDKELEYEGYFDKVFICFVLHGFPQQVREAVVRNASKALKTGGEFVVFDYNEFSLDDKPFYSRAAFKFFECPYAFDFIEKDWKQILTAFGFGSFKERLFFLNYIRLLRGEKT